MNDSRFCPSCGHGLEGESNYCSACGAALPDGKDVEVGQSSRDAPGPANSVANASSTFYTHLTLRQVLTGTTILIVFLALVASGYFLMIRTNEPKGADYFWGFSKDRSVYDMRMIAPMMGVVEGSMITRADGTETLEGRTYHKTITTYEGFPGMESDVSYSRLGSNGVYSRSSMDPDAPEILEAPLPPNIGRTWSYERNGMRMEMEIVAIDDCDTPTRTYQECLRITGDGTYDGTEIETVSYYAKKTGLVKSTTEGQGFLLEIRLRENP